MTRRQEALHRARYDTRKKTLGEDHPATVGSANGLALYLLKNTDRKEEAELLYRATYDAFKKKHGEDHPASRYTASNLASLLKQTGRTEEAAALLRVSIDSCGPKPVAKGGGKKRKR